MGERVRAVLEAEPTLALEAAIESPDHPGIGETVAAGVRVTADATAALPGCDVVIDFSRPEATLETLRAAADAKVAYVTGTTGFSAAQRSEIERLSERIPVVLAPNFSVAVNVLGWLVREAARRLGPGYDAELVELHHAAKRDAPSGTALRLAESIAEARGQKLADHLVLERAGETGARREGDIGIQTLRGGDCPGEHTVLFVGPGERLELSHRAATRDHFARGAVRAAAWVIGRPPALYRIEQVLGLDEADR
ncbi:MAG: 4-hydroxy-tetrahydrodipicolinate reductase [Deltaproteobacteria bacterium]|nr:MAG: 4-hydroxy-tetrahydrodipicolinate reductase [Deltaproteobacteria bacterium]